MKQRETNPIFKYRYDRKLGLRKFASMCEPAFRDSEILRFEKGEVFPTYLTFKRVAHGMNVDVFELMKAIYLWAYEDEEYELYDLEGNLV